MTQKPTLHTLLNHSLHLVSKIKLLHILFGFVSLPLVGQTQIGLDIDSETTGDLSGQSVSMSTDGNRVAIGAIVNDGNGSSSLVLLLFIISQAILHS